MGESEMSDILEDIDRYVASTIDSLSPSQHTTLRALLFGGYRGERDFVLMQLLKTMGEGKISHSDLTESYACAFENETAQYSRIRPEFFRAVRKHLTK